MSLAGIDQWKQTEPEQDATHGPSCPCNACERDREKYDEAAEASEAVTADTLTEQGVSPRMAMRRRRDDK